MGAGSRRAPQGAAAPSRRCLDAAPLMRTSSTLLGEWMEADVLDTASRMAAESGPSAGLHLTCVVDFGVLSGSIALIG